MTDAYTCQCGAKFPSASEISRHVRQAPNRPSLGINAGHRIVSGPL